MSGGSVRNKVFGQSEASQVSWQGLAWGRELLLSNEAGVAGQTVELYQNDMAEGPQMQHQHVVQLWQTCRSLLPAI